MTAECRVETVRWISAALLLASLLIGLAHVAGLPPFEGIDETAHYSYIEQIAKTGTLPRVCDKISARCTRCRRPI